jgi:CheY-like chemotaxis protein
MNSPALQKTRVLVVDSSATQRLIVTEMLSSDGHDVTCVPDGGTALDILTEESFDIIFMDASTGEVNNLDAFKLYRFSVLKPAPVYLMTADINDSTAKQFCEAGAAGVLSKPTTLDALREVIATACPKPVVPERALKTVHSVDRFTQLTTASAKSTAPLRAISTVYVEQEAIASLRAVSEKAEFLDTLINSAADDIHALVRDIMAYGWNPIDMKLQERANDLAEVAGSIGAERLKMVALSLASVRSPSEQAKAREMLLSLYDTARFTVDELNTHRANTR